MLAMQYGHGLWSVDSAAAPDAGALRSVQALPSQYRRKPGLSVSAYQPSGACGALMRTDNTRVVNDTSDDLARWRSVKSRAIGFALRIWRAADPLARVDRAGAGC